MKLKGKISDLNLEFLTGKPKLVLQIDTKRELLAEYDKLKNDELTIEIKKFRPHRSLNANAYAWVLMDKIAETQGITPEDVYRHHIQEVGVFKIMTIKESDADTLIKGWGMNGIGWTAEKLDYSEDKNFIDVKFYYGSSLYNTKQMTRLINNIIQDCEALGIQTKTPSEIANMLNLWEQANG